MAKAISGHSAPKSGMATANAAILVVPPRDIPAEFILISSRPVSLSSLSVPAQLSPPPILSSQKLFPSPLVQESVDRVWTRLSFNEKVYKLGSKLLN